MNNYAVILAGGRGERFWPMSRFSRPKQFVDLFDGKTLLQHAVDRLDGVIPPQNILIITSQDLVALSQKVASSIPAENIIGEPMGRDTAAACALATELVAKRDPNGVLAILTADHIMRDEEGFRCTLRDAYTVASKETCIVTIGIQPTEPATGYGYIEIKQLRDKAYATDFFDVVRFVEKPNADKAKEYVDSGRYFWNAGMFVWQVKTFREALGKFRPVLNDAMKALEPSIGTPKFDSELKRIYEGLEKISVDYAVMEHSKNIVMARGTFGWDDVGSWGAICNHFEADKSGNVVVGPSEIVQGQGNIVVCEPGHLVAVYGASDMVVVHTKDATLICPKDKVQDIKEMVKTIGQRKDGAEYI